jgi:hypothetical protein
MSDNDAVPWRYEMKLKFYIAVVSVVLLTLSTSVQSQQGTIQDILFTPEEPCKGDEVVFSVTGSGSCQNVFLQPDAPNVTLPQSSGDFPLAFTHTYTNIGTYTLVAGSSHPQCAGDAQRTLVVKNCLHPVDPDIVADLLDNLRPKILGGLGLVQPGNPFPIVVFGEKFGSQPGTIILEGQFGAVQLNLLEWGADGKFASGYIPADICGVPDHTASIRVVSASGWWSEPWPVSFTAQREVLMFPKNETQVLACSDDSNCDLCNYDFDSDDEGCFSGGSNSSISGFHYNDLFAIGDDSGKDRYRVDLTGGSWVIQSWGFDVHVDAGEGWAHLHHDNPYLEKTGNFEVDWMVTPNDGLTYSSHVFVSGPCGTSYKPGVASSALSEATKDFITIQMCKPERSRALAGLRRAERMVNADDIRKAKAADDQVQRELAKRREAVSDQTIDQADQIDKLRTQTDAIRQAARTQDADAEDLNEQAKALMQRVQKLSSGWKK